MSMEKYFTRHTSNEIEIKTTCDITTYVTYQWGTGRISTGSFGPFHEDYNILSCIDDRKNILKIELSFSTRVVLFTIKKVLFLRPKKKHVFDQRYIGKKNNHTLSVYTDRVISSDVK